MDRDFLIRRKKQLQKEDQKLANEEAALESETKNSNGNSSETGNQDGGSTHEENSSETTENNNEESPDTENSPEENPDQEDSEEESNKGDNSEDSEENEDSEEKEEEENSEEDEDSEEKNGDDKEGDKDKDASNETEAQQRKNLGPQKQDDREEENDKKNDNKEGGDLKQKALNKVNEKLGNNETVAKAQKVATNVVSTVKALASSAGIFAKVLINPIFWIIIALIIIVAGIASTVSIMGGNDYNQSCDFGGVGSVNVAEDADDHTRQSAIASWLMSTPFKVNGDQPMSKEQAAGIIGNFMQESYMANPKTIQGDVSMTQWQTCDNDCIIGWGSSGKAIGLAQWMGGRRLGLAQFAKAEGTQWYELNTQLRYLKQEIDGGELSSLVNGGFGTQGDTVENYTWIWQSKFERAGEDRGGAIYKKREAYALEFYGRFTGSAGNLSTQCVSGGPIDASNLVQLALQIAYTREEKAAGLGYGVCSSAAGCGQSFSKPEYIQAKEMVEAQTGADPIPGMTASCDRMAATLFRLTGIDVNFPYGNSHTQLAYARSNWQLVSCQNRQPGDALIRPGHIMVYIGMVDGRDTIASASIATADRVGPNGKGRSAHLSDISCRGDLFYADGDVAEGFRKVTK